eukprot:12745466-Prorocentrum_lima.AAC.1
MYEVGDVHHEGATQEEVPQDACLRGRGLQDLGTEGPGNHPFRQGQPARLLAILDQGDHVQHPGQLREEEVFEAPQLVKGGLHLRAAWAYK